MVVRESVCAPNGAPALSLVGALSPMFQNLLVARRGMKCGRVKMELAECSNAFLEQCGEAYRIHVPVHTVSVSIIYYT